MYIKWKVWKLSLLQEILKRVYKYSLILYSLSKCLLLLSFLFTSLPKLFYFSFKFLVCCFQLNHLSTLKIVNRQDYNFPSLVEVPSKDQKTWWNTRWLNERYLPSIWMEENKIQLFVITKRFNQPWKHFASLWSLFGFFGTFKDFGKLKSWNFGLYV